MEAPSAEFFADAARNGAPPRYGERNGRYAALVASVDAMGGTLQQLARSSWYGRLLVAMLRVYAQHADAPAADDEEDEGGGGIMQGSFSSAPQRTPTGLPSVGNILVGADAMREYGELLAQEVGTDVHRAIVERYEQSSAAGASIGGTARQERQSTTIERRLASSIWFGDYVLPLWRFQDTSFGANQEQGVPPIEDFSRMMRGIDTSAAFDAAVRIVLDATVWYAFARAHTGDVYGDDEKWQIGAARRGADGDGDTSPRESLGQAGATTSGAAAAAAAAAASASAANAAAAAAAAAAGAAGGASAGSTDFGGGAAAVGYVPSAYLDSVLKLMTPAQHDTLWRRVVSRAALTSTTGQLAQSPTANAAGAGVGAVQLRYTVRVGALAASGDAAWAMFTTAVADHIEDGLSARDDGDGDDGSLPVPSGADDDDDHDDKPGAAAKRRRIACCVCGARATLRHASGAYELCSLACKKPHVHLRDLVPIRKTK